MSKKDGCEIARKGFTDTDRTALEKANNTIKKMTHYGLREETAPSNGVLLSWSNGARKWIMGQSRIQKGESLSLDANELFLPANKETADRILACLQDLPLYKNSFEAKYGRM